MERELFQRFDELRNAMTQFSRSIDPNQNAMWLAEWNFLNQTPSIEEILTDLWYQDDQDGRETRVYPGLVSLSREQITFANEINLLKDKFRKTTQKLKEDSNQNWREIQGRLAQRYQPLNENLSRDGLTRLHLKQVFRHIPLVVSRPEKVGFGWYTSGRSIKKISRKEAYELLIKLNTEATHIKIQLERLSGLTESEPLARVQQQAPVLRANIVYANNKRRSLNVSLPMMFPSEGFTVLPEFNVPMREPPSQRSRLVRSDNKLEDDPFLPSIRVHRYSSNKKGSFY